jgi:hypothetical protein
VAIVNSRTAKLIKKWAAATKKPPRELKRWWITLNKFQRDAERRRMRADLE